MVDGLLYSKSVLTSECFFIHVFWVASLEKVRFEIIHVLLDLCFRGVCS